MVTSTDAICGSADSRTLICTQCYDRTGTEALTAFISRSSSPKAPSPSYVQMTKVGRPEIGSATDGARERQCRFVCGHGGNRFEVNREGVLQWISERCHRRSTPGECIPVPVQGRCLPRL